MSGIKRDCGNLITLLSECAEKCDQYVRDIVPKHHCVKPAEAVIQSAKNMIIICRNHLETCNHAACTRICPETIKVCEKVIEKSTVCIDVCMGAGSDNDAKIVCEDCVKACKDAIYVLEECLVTVCS